ncbi:DUF433 domain-containing protein [Mycobacterium malmoense]|uniref:DUF433 domain-containing protein n=1 Tax=Mycobacterium malmoense TaxID=1780 RepID=A0ABX3SPW7_MYCMA|nr:DUF433 domain-containing protein [Mycobacterium malmoense]ORA79300.1 hypothetical protein BST29_19630 [Mycobacterium malmoense]QZA18176.1 DUF433 domain-containing protein [Mycobacterium malmoense]UNB94950.1 DUF433 domain-containing protein [Mycobacterium malmoense]
MAATVSVLDREMYSEAEAARLLRVHQQTLNYWLEGKTWRGRTYLPVIRPKPEGRRTVTWAEFVEAGLLSQYRQRKVDLDEVRRFIAVLRDKTGEPYPLAHERPWTLNGRLLIEAQKASDLPPEYWLYAPTDGQLILPLYAAQEFLDRVKFVHDEAVLWRPAGPESPVVIDPDTRFGRPSVGGISTSVLKEYADDGYGYDEIAEEFGLKVRDVEMAVAYELQSKAA